MVEKCINLLNKYSHVSNGHTNPWTVLKGNKKKKVLSSRLSLL